MRSPITCFGEDHRQTLELQTRKAIELWELSGLLYRIFENNNVEGYTDNGGLACLVSEESLKTVFGPFVNLN